MTLWREGRLLPGSQAAVITNITLLTHSPTSRDLPSGRGIWVEVSENLRSGLASPKVERLTLHYHLTPQADVLAARSNGGSAGALEPITELDIVYGERWTNALVGYEKVFPMISGGEDDSSTTRMGATLAVRKALPRRLSCITHLSTLNLD